MTLSLDFFSLIGLSSAGLPQGFFDCRGVGALLVMILQWIRHFPLEQVFAIICSQLSNSLAPVRSFWYLGEQKKVVIEKSRWTALTRSSIHLLSTSISVFTISLNLRGFYIGYDFHSLIRYQIMNMALLQVAAKIQELLIVASLATIIIHLVRVELLLGDGLPLGLLGAGFEFDKMNYFWSAGLWGSLKYKTERVYSKLWLLTFILLAGTVATLAGPSCAVLLLPQSQTWPAGSSHLYLYGTIDDFWPAKVTASESTIGPWCASANATAYGVCPSAGFESLRGHYMRLIYSNFFKPNPPYTKKLSRSSYYWPIDSPSPLHTRLISLGAPSFLIQPHFGVTVLLQQIMEDWWDVLTSKSGFRATNIDDRAAIANVLSPITSVHCSPPQNRSVSDHVINFPTKNLASFPYGQNQSISTLNSTVSEFLRFSWIQLPASFEDISIGAVFESPWSFDTQTRVVVGCTIQGNWVPTEIHSDAYTFWQGWYPWNIQFKKHCSANKDAITVQNSWLKALTLRINSGGPNYHSSGPSTIEIILTDSKITDNIFSSADLSATELWQSEGNEHGNRTVFLEAIICSVFEDGLARFGSYRIYNTTGSPSSWTLSTYQKRKDFDAEILKGGAALQLPDMPVENITKIKIDLTIAGLSYKASLTTYLAMTVLCFHIIAAITHSVWTMWRYETSGCWGSVTEVIALAQNSTPAYKALKNTAGGISLLSTYSRKARIRPTRILDQDKADHLAFVFEENTAFVDEESDISPAAMIYHGQESSELVQVSIHQGTNPAESHLGLHPAENPSTGLHPSTWPVYRKNSMASSEFLQDLSPFRASSSSVQLLTRSSSSRTMETLELYVVAGEEYG